MQNSHDGKADVVKPEEGDRNKSKHARPPTKPIFTHAGRTRTKLSLKEPSHTNDAQLIRTGLRRLASNINPPIKTQPLTSKLPVSDVKKTIEVEKIITPRNLTQRILKEVSETESEEKIVKEKKLEVPTKSFEDKQTMTEHPLTGTPLALMEKTLLDDAPYSERNAELPWADPRLLEKYAMSRRYKRSLTIPLVKTSSSFRGADDVRDFSLENIMEDEDLATEIICDRSETFFLKSMYYMCTASISFIGSLCGIILITMILWRLIDDHILKYNFMNSERHISLLPGDFKKMTSALFQAWTRILRRALTVSARDVLAEDNEGGWFGMLQ